MITNSHYAGIWPVSQIACGGLLGDVIFFAVSGFCLYNIKEKFHIWYLKRIFRIYPSVLIVSGLMIAIKYPYLYLYNLKSYLNFFIYPTYFHFVASIMVLYIAFYVAVMLQRVLNIKPWHILLFTVLLNIVYYFLVFDRSYYHINIVEESTVRFLYFEAMLIGATFKEAVQNGKFKPKLNIFCRVLIAVSFTAIYFIGYVVFAKYKILCSVQILSYLTILSALTAIFYLFCSLEVTDKKNLVKGKPGKCIKFVAKCTLEIYFSFYFVSVLVGRYLPGLKFPLNFFVVTGLILVCAGIINFVSTFISDNLRKLLKKSDKN